MMRIKEYDERARVEIGLGVKSSLRVYPRNKGPQCMANFLSEEGLLIHTNGRLFLSLEARHPSLYAYPHHAIAFLFFSFDSPIKLLPF